MKRLLKKTLKNQFNSTEPQPQPNTFLTKWFRQSFRKTLGITTSVLTAATLSLVTGRPAVAVSIFPVDLNTYTGTPNNPNAAINVTDTFGNVAPINFTWTGDTGNFTVLGPSVNLTGGFGGGSILEIQHDPASLNEAVTLDIDFGAPIEQARLVVIDVDRDNANTWQDLIRLGGSIPPTSITPATAPSTPFQVSPEALAGVAGVPLGIDQANGGIAPGLATPGDYTVDIVGNEFVGVYNPRSLDANLVGAATRTEFTPQNATPTGGVAVNPTDALPNPANPPGDGVEAQNQSSEGTITADYSAAGGGTLTNLTFTYENGPASVADGLNPAGGGGYITTNDANGGPGNHGVGLYTIFIVPGSIGTAKSAADPVQVNATEFDVTYTVQVENFGAGTTLTGVQATDDLTATFGGATGFSVVSAPTVISGPGTANPNFNGNGDQNLLDGNGSLTPGQATVIQYTVRLDTAAANITPGVTYDNTVVAAGTTPIGLRITDTSVDDSVPPNANPAPNPDPNNDGDPLEQSPTPVVLPTPVPEPRINVSEEFIETTVAPADGTFGPGGANTARVLYRIRVQNTGPERLTNVELINDFTETFDNGSRGGSGPDNGFEVVSVTQTGGVANPANTALYDGGDSFDSGGVNTNNAVLATGGTLEPGEFTEYEILVDVDTSNNGSTLTSAIPGTFLNSTTATGLGSDPTTPSNRPVSDISNDGSALGLEGALDPVGNSLTGGSTIGDPGAANAPPPPDPNVPANENTPTPVTLQPTATPQINVSEQVVSTVVDPTGTYGPNNGRVTYRIRVQNTGSEDLNTVTLTNDFTETFDNGTRGGSGPDNGFEIVSLTQVDGTANAVNPAYDGGDSSDEGAGPGNTNNAELIQPGALAVGEFSEYEIVVDVDLTDNGETLSNPLPGPFDNSTTTNGIGNTSTIPVSDISNDATGLALEDQLNPAGNSPTGGGTSGNPGDPEAPAPAASPDPVNENVPTPVNFPIQPQINVSEQVVSTVIDPTGTYGPNNGRVTYRIRVQNTGPEDLTSVNLVNDFTETFDNGTRGGSGPDNGFEIVSLTQVDGVANPVNPNYDGGDSAEDGAGPNGTNDPNLIPINSGNLDVGEFSEYEIVVDVDLTDNGETLSNPLPGPFDNSTTTDGIGVTSTIPVSDISNDATGVDLEDQLNPAGNSPTGGGTSGNPGDPAAPAPTASPDPVNENVPTPVNFPTQPQINVSEQVVSTVVDPTGTYGPNNGRVTYRIRVQNTGSEDLNTVTLTNDFTETFDNGTRGGSGPDNGFEIVSLTQVDGTANAVNPAYDGGDSSDEGAGPGNTNNAELIQPGALAVGEFSEYEIVVDVDLTDNGETLSNPLPGPFDNSTTTNGIGNTSTIPVSDISNDATGLALEDQLNPAGNSPTGGGTSGNPGDPEAPAPAASPDPVNENVPTPVNFPIQPQINVSEQVVSTVIDPTGTYGPNNGRVTYRIRVQNTGPEDLTSVNLVNDFTETFDNGTRGGSGPDNGFEIVSLTQVDGVANPVNPNYDGGDSAEDGAGPNGTNDPNLIPINSGNLDVGEFSEYEIVVDVDLTDNGETLSNPLPGPFDNSTTTDGIGVTSTIPVSDISNDATGVDLEDQLNPAGNSPTGGGTSGNPGDPAAPAPPDPTDPANENTPTPVNFTTQPQINVSEQVVTTVLEPTGTYGANTGRVTYRIRVQNTGVEDLDNVLLTNDFTETFDNGTRGGSGPDNGFEIVSLTQVDGVANGVNPAYDGGDSSDEGSGPPNTDDASLIQPGTLAVGEFSEYEIVVDVDLTDNGETLSTPLPGPFDNSTTATGTGITSTIPVSDISNDLNSVTPVPADLEGALNPPGESPTGGGTVGNAGDPSAPAPAPGDSENTPTPANFVTTPEISVIERVDQSRTEIGDIAGATFGTNNVRLVYQIVVRNIGIEDLQNVVLNNDFRPTFGTSGTGDTNDFTIVTSPTLVTSGGGVTTVPVNAGFDGSGDLRLAGDPTDPTSTLNVGEFAVYEITVDVNTAGDNVAPNLPGPFDNQTTTDGIGVISGEPTSDVSNDINPFPNDPTISDPVASDPNRNLEANEPDENIATPVILGADLRLVKRITRVTRAGTDLVLPGIDDFTNQPDTDDDDTLANLAGNSLPLGLVDVTNPLQSGDVVEYTVYFFNAGVAQAANVEMCDELQVPSVLQPASLELASPQPLSNLGTDLTFAAGSPLLFPQAPLASLVESCLSFPGTFPSGTPAGGLGVGAGGGVVVGGPNAGLNVDASQVGAFRFTVTIP